MALTVPCPDQGLCGRKTHRVTNDDQLAVCQARAASASQRAKGGPRIWRMTSGAVPPPAAANPLGGPFPTEDGQVFWTASSEDLDFTIDRTRSYEGVLTTDADDGQPVLSLHSETTDAAVKSVQVTDFHGRTRRGLSVRMDPSHDYDLAVEIYVDPDFESTWDQPHVRVADSPNPELRTGVPYENFGQMSEAEIFGTGRSDQVHPVASLVGAALKTEEGQHFVRQYADRRPTYKPLASERDDQMSFSDVDREAGKSAEDSEWLGLDQVKALWTAEHHQAVHQALSELESAGGQFYLGDTVPVRDGEEVVLVEVMSIRENGTFSGIVVGGSPSSTFGHVAEDHPEDDVIRDEFGLPSGYAKAPVAS